MLITIIFIIIIALFISTSLIRRKQNRDIKELNIGEFTDNKPNLSNQEKYKRDFDELENMKACGVIDEHEFQKRKNELFTKYIGD